MGVVDVVAAVRARLAVADASFVDAPCFVEEPFVVERSLPV